MEDTPGGRLETPPYEEKIDFLRSTCWAWDQRAVTASIEHESDFNKSCWHITRMFCLSAAFACKESPCESWFSQLKYIYHPVQGPSTSTLARRLRARCAGLRGGPADETFVQRLAERIFFPMGDRFEHTPQTPPSPVFSKGLFARRFHCCRFLEGFVRASE